MSDAAVLGPALQRMRSAFPSTEATVVVGGRHRRPPFDLVDHVRRRRPILPLAAALRGHPPIVETTLAPSLGEGEAACDFPQAFPAPGDDYDLVGENAAWLMSPVISRSQANAFLMTEWCLSWLSWSRMPKVVLPVSFRLYARIGG